jgi:hypothetical protein
MAEIHALNEAVEAAEETPTPSKIDTVLLESKRTELEAARKQLLDARDDFSTRRFVVEGGSEMADSALAFVRDKASWKGAQCMNIEDLYASVSKEVNILRSGKASEFALTYEILYSLGLYLSQTEGQGVAEASTLKGLVKAVIDSSSRAQDAFEGMKQYEYKIRELEFQVASLEHGLPLPDDSSESEEPTD